LPYEKILAANFRQNVRLREENGYKLYQAVK
jgi:16S rRNA G1207 methylase RsmC